MASAGVWRPSWPSERPRGFGRCGRFAALGAVGAAALLAWGGSDEAFANVAAQHNRPAGHTVIVQELPRGMVCRAAEPDYALDRRRQGWSPYPQWRGEKTYHPSAELQDDENRQWYHFDAEGKTLGHLAQAVAATLRGKDSPLYDPTRDVGAFVVVTNCEKIRVSGKKYHYKLYFRNLSYRPGHLKVERFKDLQKRFPERILMRAAWGAMPKTPACRRIFKDRLKLYVGPNHNYYHKEPVEYPMHKIKDCTHTQNLPRRSRIRRKLANIPKVLEREAKTQEKADKLRLSYFRSFMRRQLKQDGEEAASRMELDEFARRADEIRMDQVFERSKGLVTPKVKKSFYLGLNIEKKRVSGNRGWSRHTGGHGAL